MVLLTSLICNTMVCLVGVISEVDEVIMNGQTSDQQPNGIYYLSDLLGVVRNGR